MTNRYFSFSRHRTLAVVGCSIAVILATVGVLSAWQALLAQDAPSAKDAVAPIKANARPVDFQSEIQPILARRCYRCHGPETGEGSLRLNKREHAFSTKTDSGKAAIVPGKLEASELIARIVSEDPDERMPAQSKPLTAGEIDLLKRWVAEGAAWQDHWAFQPLAPPTLPKVKNTDWVKNPIDQFILAKLEERGIAPAPKADKRTLARRAYFDLTGLPPTPQEMDEFLADERPDAFAQLVEKLLASPRYGETWARYWLDVVRFGETNSFERDGAKPHVWRYRDYVIRALNDDKPYDQFVREQLAGDEFEKVTPDSLIATGYYRLGLWDDEPADRELARFDGLDDLVATTSHAFLGLTVSCARCHDHKIDPIPQRDYYQLAAFFENVKPYAGNGPNIEQPLPMAGPEQARRDAERAKLEAERNALQAKVSKFEAAFAKAFRERNPGAAEALPSDLDDVEYRFYRDTWQKLPEFDKLKAETTAKSPTPYFDIGLATRDTAFGFVFTGILKVPADGKYTFELDSDDGSRLIINGAQVVEYDGIHGTGTPRSGIIRLKAGRVPIRLEYFQGVFGKGLTLTWSSPKMPARLLTPPPQGDLPKQDLPALVTKYGETLLGKEAVADYRKDVAELVKRKETPGKLTGELALCVTENGASAKDMFIMERGNPRSPGAKVVPGFPAVTETPLPQLPRPKTGAKTTGRRTVLANWIVSPENRLAGRVIANRLWQHHFGRGIVRSPNNFGNNGAPPTHPQLLDWLACELRDKGWKMKDFHRLVMNSNTYQMASTPSAEALAKDPENNLFWRYDMRRLSAESIRDTVLAVSGNLNTKMFGPSIFPEISAEVLQGQSVPGQGWKKSSPEDAARRSIYIHIKRSLTVPMLAAFDVADSDTSCEARFVTTQPAQALALMHGKFLNDQAGIFAKRLQREAGKDSTKQIQLATRLALGRTATDAELKRDLALLESLQKNHKLSADDSLKYYCLTVLNLNEFVYVE